MSTVTKIKGYVQNVDSRLISAGTTYNVAVAGVKYGTWTKRPTCVEGDLVEFAATQNAAGYWNVKGDIILLEKATARTQTPVAAPEIPITTAAPAPAVRGNVEPREDAKERYWRQREERDVQTQKQITYQGSRNASIAFVDLLLKNGALTFDKGKNKSDVVEGLVLHYAQVFYDDTFNLGRSPVAEPGQEQETGTPAPTTWKGLT